MGGHYNVGDNNPMSGKPSTNLGKFGLLSHGFKHGETLIESNCIDCNKELSKLAHYYGSILCRSCAAKHRKSNLKGSNNPSWKGGKPKCLDCSKELTDRRAKRCHSCETKRKHKEGIINISGKNHYMFGKIAHHGKCGTYKGIWMRSSYELNFAIWLDKQNIKWLYESKTFDLGKTTYTPDFYLPEFNLYIEVKGWWRDDAKYKFNLFKQIYCGERIKVLEKEELQSEEVLL